MPQPLAVTAFMASPGRFELPAPRLGGVCSIQLSYGDIFDFSWSRMERSASQDFDDLIIRRRVLYPAELLGHMQICRLKLRTIFVRRLIACILYNALPCLSSFHAGLSARPARFAYLCFTGCSARPRRRSIRRSFPLFSRSSFVFSSENAASTPISSDSSLC